jgi:carnitine 3-dehydrogenase
MNPEDQGGHVAVIGTGLIGGSWAALFLARGHDVVAFDPAPGAQGRLVAQVENAWPDLKKIGLAHGASRDRLTFARSTVDAVRGSSFVQESGPERLDLKQAVLENIETGVDSDVLIASSSSGLTVTEMQLGARHPERLVLGHPFNPPHLIPLVEVIGGRLTSEGAVERAMTFYRALGKQPVRVRREVPGHVANRLQAAVWREAFGLVQNGVISVADLDTVMTNGPGLRWALLGPFATLHAGGGKGGVAHMLDHLGSAIRQWSDDLYEFPETDEYVEDIRSRVDASFDQDKFQVSLAERNDLLLRLIAMRDKTKTLAQGPRKESER